MRVAVLGGAGLTGRCAVRALAESDEVDSGVVADLDGEAAREASDLLGRGKFDSAGVDVRNLDATAKVLRGCDVVINGVQYYFNLDVMEAALKARVHYLDFGGLFHTTLKQLAMDETFRSRGLTAIVGMGGMPGMTNVVARLAADSLERVDSIEIRDGAKDLTRGVPPFMVTWSLDTFFDELTMDAPVFQGGKLHSIPALSRSETIRFPGPVGVVRTYVTIHSEVATLPVSFRQKGIRKVDWMEGVPGLDFLRTLVSMGLASTDQVEFGNLRVSPRRFILSVLKERGLIGFPKDVVPDDWEVTSVFVRGKTKGLEKRLRYDVVVPPRKDWKMSCAQYGVGIPGSIAARMIGKGMISRRGVLPPEVAVDPGAFVSELRHYGFKVSKKQGGRSRGL